MCSHLTTKIEKLSLENLDIVDEQLERLVKRCKNIEELDLNDNRHITEASISVIACHLSTSLKKLVLPQLFCLEKFEGSIKVLGKMSRLEFLWLLLPEHPFVDLIEEQNHRASLQKIFPNLTVNPPRNVQEQNTPHEQWLGRFRDGPRIAYNFIRKRTRLFHFKPQQQMKRKINEKTSGSSEAKEKKNQKHF